jgi:hypothetical protein
MNSEYCMQVAFAFLLSCFFTSSRTANVATWIWVLGSGLFVGNLLDSIFAADRWWALLIQFIPTAGAFRYVLLSYCQQHRFQICSFAKPFQEWLLHKFQGLLKFREASRSLEHSDPEFCYLMQLITCR